jgi:DNA-binding CsgD family transcriptional regulator
MISSPRASILAKVKIGPKKLNHESAVLSISRDRVRRTPPPEPGGLAPLPLLDALEEGVALYAPSGVPIHRNAALQALLGGADAVALAREVARFATRCCAHARERGPTGADGVVEVEVDELYAHEASYRLRGILVGDALPGEPVLVVVTVSPLWLRTPAPEALVRRFGLTRREAHVARLLAEGKSNAEIARELHLSVHTVRNHVLHVKRKLGVRSRSQVGPRIAR